jgi:hypothetical protein
VKRLEECRNEKREQGCWRSLAKGDVTSEPAPPNPTGRPMSAPVQFFGATAGRSRGDLVIFENQPRYTNDQA